MALFKRGKRGTYQYDFQYNGERYQGSTQHTNKEDAARWLRQFRVNLVNERVGIIQKAPPPILSTFLQGIFTAHIEQHAKSPETKKSYLQRIKTLCSYVPFTQLTLDKIGELETQGFKECRLQQKAAVATINLDLRILRKCLIFAQTCGLIQYRKVRSLPGEKSRDFVLSFEQEKLYLERAPYPLKQAAILMLDLGLRVSEATSLRKDAVSAEGVSVVAGKTANARRFIPQTGRTTEVFQFLNDLHPNSEWVFPGLNGGHYSRTALENLHLKLRRVNPAFAIAPGSANEMVESGIPAMHAPTVSAVPTVWPREFVLHSMRHTCLTRWAESGMKVWTLQKLAGHSSIKISEKYVHIGSDHAAVEMAQAERYAKFLRGELEPDHAPSEEKLRTS